MTEEKLSHPSQVIYKLIKSRATSYKRATKKILDSIQPAIEAVEEFMEVEAAKKIGAYVEWQDVDAYGDEEASVVFIVGELFFPVGTEIDTDTEGKVVVTEDTAPYFRRLLRVGLPTDIAEGTKEDVLAYLRNLEENEKSKKLVDELDEQTDTDFDYSKLTEEQSKLLISKIGQA